MTIQYLSDLHFGTWFKEPLDEKAFDVLYDHCFEKQSDVIIVAGDMGESNTLTCKAMKRIKERYCKHLICVFGNHDYYLPLKAREHYRHDSFQRAKELKSMLEDEGIIVLDGTVVEIDGVRFGGAMGWYDGAWAKKHFKKLLQVKEEDYLNKLWRQVMEDAHNILGISHYMEMFERELPKIEAVYQKCDIMVTHVSPSIEKDHVSPMYQKDEGAAYFTFDGKKYLQNGSMRYWIYGHSHIDLEYEVNGVQVLSAQLGYPRENQVMARCFEV